MGAGSKLRGLFGRKHTETGSAAHRGAADPYPSSQRPQAAAPSPSQVSGGQADSPTEIPAQGWKQVLLRTKQQIKEDNVSLLAAGVAFYAFIALFPALIAAVTVYGLVADPAQVEDQVRRFSDVLPPDELGRLSCGYGSAGRDC